MLSSVLLFSNFIWEIVWNFSQFNLRMARIDEAHGYLFGDDDIVRTSPDDQPEPAPVPFHSSVEITDLVVQLPRRRRRHRS